MYVAISAYYIVMYVRIQVAALASLTATTWAAGTTTFGGLTCYSESSTGYSSTRYILA